MAGLIVPSRVFDRVHKYLDMAAVDDGAHYGYKPGHAATPAMTAEALLCRQYLGWKRDDPRLVQGCGNLTQESDHLARTEYLLLVLRHASHASHGRGYLARVEQVDEGADP